jgi:hypothetical protein
LQEFLLQIAVSDVDWDRIIQHAAAAGTAGDLLQLALNSTNYWVANTAATRIRSAHLEADAARRLLITAALRQHTSALLRLTRLEVFERQLDASTLEKVIHLALDWPACRLASWPDTGLADLLCKKPAAALLSSEQLARLLQKAVGSNDGLCVKALLALPVAKQLSTVCMEQLLHLAVVSRRQPSQCASVPGCATVAVLCSTPAARALSCDAVARLLQTVAQLGEGAPGDMHYMRCTRHLRQLPAARMLSEEAAIGY